MFFAQLDRISQGLKRVAAEPTYLPILLLEIDETIGRVAVSSDRAGEETVVAPGRNARVITGRGDRASRCGPLALTAIGDRFDKPIFQYLTGVLQVLGQAAFVYGRNHRVIVSNAKADAFVETLVSEAGNLRFRDSASADAFAEALDRIFDQDNACPGPINVDLADGEGIPLTLQLWSLPAITPSLAPAGAALVLVLEGRRHPDEVMAGRFGLSKTEMRIVRGLFAGETVQDIAARHRVKRDTIRSQLKSIFAKTRTGRQSQIVALYAKAHAAETYADFEDGPVLAALDGQAVSRQFNVAGKTIGAGRG